MPLPESVAELVTRFEVNRSEYHKGHYNETQTRIDYVNPLFAALGWDINNTQGLSEVLRDVVHEDAVKIGGTMKAPDYGFRIGGTRKFFVETKKPSVHLFLMEAPAFQLRRYAWTVKMPLSILTNFEEFAVYDTRVPPDKKDPAKKARLEYVKYTDYADRWDEIASRFSYDAVLSGAFDQYAEEARDKRISVPVDVAFLSEISGWREKLARNIVQNNPGLAPRELNYAVQMIIDRLIFLRISEDRGVEPEHLLQPLMNRGGPVYPRLLDIFHRADARYNSGLFHFGTEAGRDAPDDITPRLTIDDRPLREIIASVYYPESPFEFSVFPADILGQVYEQFLGKVIRVSGKTASVEDKPEVKKAGGVYYTPTYIVDYIVRNTVGKLVDGKTPAQVAKLTVLDPACGSGSFLIGAYQFLLDWHLKYYTENDRAKWTKGKNATIYPFRKDAAGVELWRLTTAEKKRILLANIYGVDIDTQAVEVTKLSLLLKVLEGESAELINNTLTLYKERALPDLESNIKCGNSLIGPDFYAGKDMALFDLDTRLKINTFDWNKGFPAVMKAGGFDAVIGNPPWISLSGKFGVGIYSKAEVSYLLSHFSGNTYMPNMYEYFVSQGLSLTKKEGFFSFVVPDRLGFNSQFVQLRKRILTETQVHSLLYKVPFPGVTADTLIFVLHKAVMVNDQAVEIAEYNKQSIWRSQEILVQSPNFVFEFFEKLETMELAQKISSSPHAKTLKTICETTSGFGGKSSLLQLYQTSPKQIRAIKGDSIGRYEFGSSYWFDFCKANITGRTTDQRKLGASPKILFRKTGKSIVATYDESGIFPEQSLYFLYDNASELNMKYLTGLINSRLMLAYYQAKSLTNKNSIAQVKKVDLDQLPIRTINFSIPTEKAKHDKMVSLVERMLTLHKDKAGARLEQEKTMLQQEIEATDAQIDRLVYDLYGLTEEEIKVVEGAA